MDLAGPRLHPWREVDLEEVFARVPFRCRRCGAHAHALRATRPAPGGEGVQVLLSIGTRRSING